MSFSLANYPIKGRPLAQASVAFGGVTSSYTLIIALTESIVKLIIYSSFDQDVQLSFDGVTDFMPFPAGATLILDLDKPALPAGYGVYIKQLGVPTLGSLYVSRIAVGP